MTVKDCGTGGIAVLRTGIRFRQKSDGIVPEILDLPHGPHEPLGEIPGAFGFIHAMIDPEGQRLIFLPQMSA